MIYSILFVTFKGRDSDKGGYIMNKVSIAGAVVGAVFLVIGIEYLLIHVFDVDTYILQSLKALVT